LRPGCHASFAVSAGRHSRRASAAGMPIQWASPPCSPWHRDPHLGSSSPAHGGTPAYVTDGDGRAWMRRARSALCGRVLSSAQRCAHRSGLLWRSRRSRERRLAGWQEVGPLTPCLMRASTPCLMRASDLVILDVVMAGAAPAPASGFAASARDLHDSSGVPSCWVADVCPDRPARGFPR
jgi:hypothetical protein